MSAFWDGFDKEAARNPRLVAALIKNVKSAARPRGRMRKRAEDFGYDTRGEDQAQQHPPAHDDGPKWMPLKPAAPAQ